MYLPCQVLIFGRWCPALFVRWEDDNDALTPGMAQWILGGSVNYMTPDRVRF